ncbi:MAG: hypothetical protein ACK5KP_02520 [Paludibacteraceae bacterium]
MLRKIILFIVAIVSIQTATSQNGQQLFWALNKCAYYIPNMPYRPSFAFSMRKLYCESQYALLARSGTTVQGNVGFDGTGIVSSFSKVKITVGGTVGSTTLTVGQEVPYTTFAGTNTVYIVTWYDQGPNKYHATQTTTANQPELALLSAGAGSNTKSSIKFNTASSSFLKVDVALTNLLTNGYTGSLFIATKTTSNNTTATFGVRFSNNWRWATHINWKDDYCYFDAEGCCVGTTNRKFANSVNQNIWREYTFIRSGKKIARVSGAEKLNVTVPTVAPPAGANGFGIGSYLYDTTSEDPQTYTYSGYISEFILFPNDLSASPYLARTEDFMTTYWSL